MLEICADRVTNDFNVLRGYILSQIGRRKTHGAGTASGLMRI